MLAFPMIKKGLETPSIQRAEVVRNGEKVPMSQLRRGQKEKVSRKIFLGRRVVPRAASLCREAVLFILRRSTYVEDPLRSQRS